MFNVKEFINSLIDINVKRDILETNEKEFELSSEILDFAENNLIPEISSPFHNIDGGQITINNTVLLLLVQAIKSYKSSLLLCLDGYYTSSVIVIRNILDIVFNTEIYFREETPEESISRADDYLNNLSKWTNALFATELISPLAQPYMLFIQKSSDFTHANSKSTLKNITKDGDLSFLPTSENIEESLVLTNTVFYYLLELLCGYYKINFDDIKKIDKTPQFEKKYRTYKMFNFSKRYYDDK